MVTIPVDSQFKVTAKAVAQFLDWISYQGGVKTATEGVGGDRWRLGDGS